MRICGICNVEGIKKITKQQPEVYEETVVTRKEYNKKTRQFETITKTVMKLQELPDEPDEQEIIENNTCQYLENRFIYEHLIPYCSNVLNNIRHVHYGHYSCLRDMIINDRVHCNKHKCPMCRTPISIEIVNMILLSPMFVNKMSNAIQKNELLKKFKITNDGRTVNFLYKNGSYLFEQEIFKQKQEDDDTRSKFMPIEVELYDEALKVYTNKVKTIAASKHGFKKYIKLKNNFFKNISQKFKGNNFDNEYSDYAFCFVTKNENIVDPRLNDYLKKHCSVSSINTIEKTRYYIMSYLIVYMLRNHFNNIENVMKYVEQDIENRKIAVWLVVLNLGHFMFNDFEIARYAYKEIMSCPVQSVYSKKIPIPLYCISTEHVLWLYENGFVFTRFAYSKEHGKKLNNYMISIPSLLFWEGREYDTSIKSISNNIVNGSGIDRSVADAIATISYEARTHSEYPGTVLFEDGPYLCKDMTTKEWQIKLFEELAIEKRLERSRQQRELEDLQEIEGLCVAECFNERPAIVINETFYYYERLCSAIYNPDDTSNLEKYVYYKYNALKSGLRLNITLIQINRQPWLKKLIENGENGTVFYYTVLIDLFMNVIITGGCKTFNDEHSKIVQTANFCNVLVNKILGKICNDFSIGSLKYMLDNCVNFGNYVDFVNNKSYGAFEHTRWDMLKEHVDYVSTIYAKMLVYSMKMVQTARVDFDKYQHSLHKIAQDKTIIYNVPHFVLYLNRIVTNGFDEEDSEKVVCFITLLQKILEFVYTNASIKKVNLYVKNKKSVLGEDLKKINVEIFSDMIIKRNDIEMNTKLTMKNLLTTTMKKLQE
jgi:hypothetical protein